MGEAGATDYVALADGTDGAPSRWRLVPLVLGMGLGGHAATQAFTAAEPALHEAGLSPMQFSALSLAPHLASLLMPTVWGDAFARSATRVLVLAPALMLAGQTLIAAGLLRNAHGPADGTGLEEFGLIGLGFLAFSTSRAGLAVVQYAALLLYVSSTLLHDSTLPPSRDRCTRPEHYDYTTKLHDNYFTRLHCPGTPPSRECCTRPRSLRRSAP